MTERPENSAPGPAGAEPGPAAPGPAENAPTSVATAAPTPHRHRFLIGTAFTLATIIGVFAVLAVWVNRQVLNTDNWTSTSSKLLADKQIQSAISAYSVDQLFKSGVPQAKVKSTLSELPKPLQGLDAPITSGLQQLAGQVAPKVLASQQVQTAWREANRVASATFVKIVNGGGNAVSTNGGVVTLNLHAIVDQLASTLGLQSQVASARSAVKSKSGTVSSAAGKAGVTLPASNGQLVILRSNQLKTVQDVANGIKNLALVLPIVAFGLFILAVWLSKGHRRESLRLTGWCFVGIGLLVLIARRFLGNAIVDDLVKNAAYRPAGHDAWTIATTLLYDIGAALVAYGLVFVAVAWLAGRTRPATALRRAMAPTLHSRPALYFVGVYVALLLVILWGPTPATRQLPYIIAFIALLAIGVTALRRQTAREFPDAQPGDSMGSIVAWNAEGHQPSPSTVAPNPDNPGPSSGHVAELERLAELHDRGALTDAEFATEKAALVNGG